MASLAGLPPIPAVQRPIEAKQAPVQISPPPPNLPPPPAPPIGAQVEEDKSSTEPTNNQGNYSIQYSKAVQNMQNKMIEIGNTIHNIPSSANVLSQLRDKITSLFNTGKKLGVSDGKWGDKTTVALKNIQNLAQQFISMSYQYNIPLKSFTEKELQELKSIQQNTKIPTEDKANQITELLDRLSDTIREEFAPVVQSVQNLSFSPEEKEYYNSITSPNLEIPEFKSIGLNITWGDLMDRNSFDQFLRNQNMGPEQVINVLKAKLSGQPIPKFQQEIARQFPDQSEVSREPGY